LGIGTRCVLRFAIWGVFGRDFPFFKDPDECLVTSDIYNFQWKKDIYPYF
jgi:hypothetical protein